jgi:cell division septum initiation protein DivIVA
MTAADELIQKIAAKNGVMVGRDDPVMIVHTMLELFQADLRDAQTALLRSHREELEAHAGRWGAEAKEKAERILSAALSASKALMSEASNESASIAAKRLAEQVEASLEEANRYVAAAQMTSRASLVAAGLTVLAATITLIAVLLK